MGGIEGKTGLNLVEVVNNKVRTFADELISLEKGSRIQVKPTPVFGNDGTSKVKEKGKNKPLKVEGPEEIEAGQEAVYTITEFEENDETTLEQDKKKMSWALYIDEVEIKDNLLEYITLRGFEKKGHDCTTDFMQMADVQKRTRALKKYGIMYFRVEGDKPKETTRVTLKFSKWLDGHKVHIEAYRNKPDLDSGKGNVATTTVKAPPEIIDAYWVNENKEKITNKLVGYKDPAYVPEYHRHGRQRGDHRTLGKRLRGWRRKIGNGKQ